MEKHFDEDSVGQARFDSAPIMFSPVSWYLNTSRNCGLIMLGDDEQRVWISMDILDPLGRGMWLFEGQINY